MTDRIRASARDPSAMIEVPLWQSRFLVPETAVELFLDELEDAALSIAAFEEPQRDGADGPLWRVELMHRGEPDQQALAGRLVPLAERSGLERIDLTIAPLAATNWLARVAESFAPQRIGRFWVHGSHVGGAAPAGAVAIQIDAGLAFGSGEHESTRGCLLALDDLARRRRFRRVLDLGCGSGILAIAAAKLGAAQVDGVDVDPQAIRASADNARANGVDARFMLADALPLTRADVVVANILANPLILLAPALAARVRDGGRIALAGILVPQAAAVQDAYAPWFTLAPWREHDGWVLLAGTRRARE
jgi:ribosomal protein L11 methyltransferase